MKKLIIFTILLLSSINFYAQYTLTGKVTDIQTKEPLTGVNIYIPELKKGTISDINGGFNLKNITVAKITVHFSYEGYAPLTKKIVFKQSIYQLEVRMHKTVLEMDEVIISTGTNKLQKDNVMKVAHKSLSGMQKKGIQNIMEGIAQIPGVSNLSTGTGIAKPVIRGLTGNRVLVYNQGVRLENYQFGEEHGMGIDASGIQSVEVIKGPASLLYGSDAMGGVVYLVPEKYAPKHKNTLHINSQFFSNTSGVHSSIGYKTSGEHWKLIARGAYKLNADYQIPNGQRVVNSANNTKDFKMGIGYQSKDFKSDFRYNYNRTQNGMATDMADISPAYKFIGKYQDLTTHNFSLKNDFTSGKSHFKTNVGFSQVRRKLIKLNNPFIDMQLQTFNADIKWYLPEWKHWESIVGLQGMHQINTNYGQHFLLQNALINNIGLFANLNRKFNKTIIQTGLRYDYRTIHTETINTQRPGFENNLSSFSGALGLKQELNDQMNLRFNLASGFRAPNLAELTSNGEHEGRIELGNPNLKNEQNIQADLNWDYSSTHFEFFVNAFYNKIHHYIYLAPQNMMMNMLPVYAYKQDNVNLYGGETGIHLHPHPLDWLHIKSSYEMVVGKKQTGEYLPLIPADQWKNEIRLTKKQSHKSLRKYYMALEINHTFKARTPETEEYPGYTLINARVGADFKYKKMKASVFLAAHNLLNKTYISNLSILKEKGIPNQGRNFILGLDVKF